MKNGTRHRIVAAAQKLFSTYGYDGTSVDSIAAEARVAKVTIYRHFENKEALFATALQDILDALPVMTNMVPGRSDSLRARLMEVARDLLAPRTSSLMLCLQRMLTIGRKSAATTAEQLWESNFQPYREAVHRLLKEAQEKGALRTSDPRIAATHLLSLVAGEPMIRLFITGSGFGNTTDADHHARAAVDIFLRAYDSGRSP